MKPNVLVFDAYGTLFNVHALDGLIGRHFKREASDISAWWRRKQLEYTWLHTLMGTYKPFSDLTFDALDFTFDQMGLSMPMVLRKQLLEAYLELDAFEGVSDLLPQLKSKGWDLAILSNADSKMLKGAVASNGLQEVFSTLLSADDIKLYKPRPEVYQMAVDYFDCSPQQIIFISSNTWDVAGAKQFGLRVAWLNRSGGTLEPLGPQPDWHLSDLAELLNL